MVSQGLEKPQSYSYGWLTWALPILAVLIAYRAAPWFAFISDDVFLIPANPFLRGPGALWRNLTHDYFWSASGNAIPYWRPVTKGSWVLEYALWNGWSGGFHMDQVAIHLVSVLGVVYFVRRLGGGNAGGCVAGLVFGLNPNLIEPTCSVMARSDVAVTAAAIWTVVAWFRWVESGRTFWAVVHGLCLVLALGSKETAVVLPGVLALWAILGAKKGNPILAQEVAQEVSPTVTLAGRMVGFVRKVRHLVPAVILTAAYLVAREFVLGAHTRVPLVFDPLRVALVGGQSFFSVLPFHLVAMATSVPKEPWLVPASIVWPTLGWLVFAAALAVSIHRRRLHSIVLLAWALASLAPILLVSDLNVPVALNLFPLAGRWVAPVVAVSAILMGLAVGWRGWLPRPRLRVVLIVVAAGWALVELATSGSSHAAFRDTDSLVRQQDAAFFALPEARRTLTDRCDFAERQILRAIKEEHPQQSIEQLDALDKDCLIGGGRFRLLRLRALVDLSRFDDAFVVAVALFREDVMERRHHAEAYYLAGVAASATHQLQTAESWLRTSMVLGYPSCNLRVSLGLVLAQTGRIVEAAGLYEEAGNCALTDARPWLAAATLWMKAQQPGQAGAALERALHCPLDGDQRQLAERLAAALK